MLAPKKVKYGTNGDSADVTHILWTSGEMHANCHDNTRPHTAALTQQTLENFPWQLLNIRPIAQIYRLVTIICLSL